MTTLTDLIAEARASGCTHAPLPIEEVERVLRRLEGLWLAVKELCAKLHDEETERALARAENERLKMLLCEYVEESCWNAFNDGVVKVDLWMDGGMSTGKWLQHGLGLPYERGWHPVEEVKAGIPGLVARIVKGGAS